MKYNLIALACAILFAVGLSLTVTAGPIPDTDCDGVDDVNDNCMYVSNTGQNDIDQDGYGQPCDGDFDQSGKTAGADFVTFKADYNVSASGKETDHDCSGKTAGADFVTFKALYNANALPGPSGQTCASMVNGSCPGNPNSCP